MCSTLKCPTSRVYPSGPRCRAQGTRDTKTREWGNDTDTNDIYKQDIYKQSYEGQRDVRLTAVRPQYSRLINTSKGALATARAFLTKNNF